MAGTKKKKKLRWASDKRVTLFAYVPFFFINKTNMRQSQSANKTEKQKARNKRAGNSS